MFHDPSVVPYATPPSRAAPSLLARVGLRFDPEAEAAFQEEYARAAVHPMRLAMAAGVFLCAAFARLDPVVLPDAWRRAWAIRFFVVCPAVLALLAFSFTRWFKAVAQPCLTAAFLLFGLGLVAMMAGGPRDGRDPHYAGLILVALGATIGRMRFVWAAAASVLITAAYVVMAGWLRPRSADVLVNNIFFIVAGNLLGVVAGFELERYARRDFVQRRQLAAEEEMSRRLLLNVLPEPVAYRLKRDARAIADDYPEATVLFADLVEFTKWCGRVEAQALVAELNRVFSAFDRLCDERGLEKIKTIGDCYMAVAGLPVARPDHAAAVADMALAMAAEVDRLNAGRDESLRLRIGINTGPVVAGVIGTRKFIYDLWGDAVNVASRMESHGVPGRIHVTEAVRDRLAGDFEFEARGTVEVKGKGPMATYFLVGRKCDGSSSSPL